MLNRYYSDELNKLKSLAGEFAKENPSAAPMLAGTSSDPDVERLLEGVAFLTGLTRQKLDDEFPEFVQELTNLLFPHYLRPIPASSLISFTPEGLISKTAKVPAGTELASLQVDGTACRFRTTRDLDVQPLRIVDTNLLHHVGAKPVLMIDLELQGGATLEQWDSDNIRLFLGSGYVEAVKLFLLLADCIADVRVSSGAGEGMSLGAESLVLSGFDKDMLIFPRQAFGGFQTLQEFFAQPEKFLFIDVCGLCKWTGRGKGARFSLIFTFQSVPEWMPEISTDSFMLHVVPAINLFKHAADPIALDHRKTEYQVIPEAKDYQHFQVYSVDHVTGFQQGNSRERTYVPFALFRHDGRGVQLSYRTTRRAASVGRGSNVYLSINYPPSESPAPETLSIQVTCTNRSLPESLKLGDINQRTSSSPDRMTFRNIRPVSEALDPPAGEELLWSLLSHVSLNFLSIANAENLQKLLLLYVFSGRQGKDVANRRRIDGIRDVKLTPETRLAYRGVVRRGHLIRILCHVDYFAGLGDMYLFGCILERFLAEYAGINCYTRVEVEDALSGRVFKWQPRLGQQAIL